MKHKNDLSFNAKLNGKQKFGFRKLSVGLAAVALGTTFFLSNGQLIHADVENDTQASEAKTEEVDSQSQSTQNHDEDVAKNDQANQSQQVKEENDSAVNKQPAAQKDDEATTTLKVAQHPQTLNSKQLEESKINSSDVTIKTDDTDKYTVNNLKKDTLMACQDPIKVNVNINFKNANKDITKNNPIQIAVTNADADNQFNHIKVNTKISNNGDWNIQYADNGIYNATWKGTSSPTELKFNFHILGDDSTIKTPTMVAPVVTVKYDDKTIPSTPTLLYQKEYTPFEDKVNEYELIKGFHLAETTVKKK
ncbi:YSIRK-type signal peptide-containing protein [Lactobacillus helveticus]|uniref:YSIRK Gram-positive signal peptide domain-containing protein n=2 Tax=Lactobacillus helveticus TaxID=1587 RepID=A0A8H9KHQ8_LACHE|nr:YSIRK-type signal peptide-containing protein [Lactobacillus helveticus]KRO15266.1 hypothetical protein IV62_GL000444 [Lactobacillus helveticus]GFO99753.1 hypothetical protein LHEH8_15090 [Lactobacillus helveticus]GFP01260.1 hypothetical protein LHEW6_10930 [Lactobacillus helveticus]GFP02525.1 hypothetical protein LHEY10_04540 [Lactobacillus helveticus]